MNRTLVALFLFSSLGFAVRLHAQDCGATQPRVAEPATLDEEMSSNPGRTVARQTALMLKGEYDSVDFLANRLRSRQTHLPNGNWALTRFYAELNPPKDEIGSPRYLKALNDWIAAKPDSITARIALANFYHQWAYDARGNGVACTVSPQMWKLYEDRAGKAHEELDAAANMQPMDPEWFSAMMAVAIAEQWPKQKMRDLFDRAVAFAPDYFPFYSNYTNHILPKWFGSPGEAEAFAKSAADAGAAKMGAGMGDILYFHMSEAIMRGGKDQFTLAKIDWPRIQRGHAAHVAKYGDSITHENEYAYMAYQFRDAAEARKAFAFIGTQWGPNVWKRRQNFELAHSWAMNGSAANGTAQGSPADLTFDPF